MFSIQYFCLLFGRASTKESKLEIMTDMSKSHLYKHLQMSNTCADRFGRDIK